MVHRFALFLFALCIAKLFAWSPPSHQHQHAQHRRSCRGRNYLPSRVIMLAGDDDDDGNNDDDKTKELFQDNTNNEESTSTSSSTTNANAVYGVSYIGGDPCGSKYNDDPFDDKASFKPGLPESMKDRIAALAAKRLEEAE
mmetsp:Transcript_30633/g.64173  ORF Transcript_30633/g.64173 Transcript_30633/m.64173 type:complete len:141 (+) Transcript_30633:150-572(+)